MPEHITLTAEPIAQAAPSMPYVIEIREEIRQIEELRTLKDKTSDEKPHS